MESNGDTLRLIIDSSNAMTHVYKREILFKIDPDYVMLYELGWSEEMIKDFKHFLSEHCNNGKVKLKKSDLDAIKAGGKNRALHTEELFRCAL
jgi:hypothetical protein